ncbi:helix-turn-helix transcriptional regulator [Ensifer sp. ENS07]|uniref:helix-turn-helix domain-containing protein n=1 Tax=Ensifer sp. ENS07 TaxID=2769274 RepID=UPI0017819195|nr:AraC family transcriptional regulator [Ensifer sp. ENS07]MBD9641875.1 helix-turn-helix transcriptional regulator [Ensifer sp. ENS07]
MRGILEGHRGFAFGEAIYPAGGIYGPLRDRYHTLLLVHEGRAKVICDGEVRTVTSRRCSFFRNERSIEFLYPEGRTTRVSWCEGYAADLTEIDAARLRSLPPQLAFSQRIEAIQRMGVELGSGSGHNLNMLRNALGESLFMAFFHEAQLSEEERQIPRSVQRARFYIEENYEKQITLDRLAALVGVTPQHLVSSFRRHLGLTPVRYLWQTRAVQAHSMLLQSDFSLSEIAYRCGYKNQFHLSRQISERYGKPPREVRAGNGYWLSSDIAEAANDISFYSDDDKT